MQKSLKEYALAAEIVGAVAVVVSLIYVGVSVNQNTAAVQVANHQALVALDQETSNWFRDPDFAAAYEVAKNDVDKLSVVQRAQVGSFIAGKMNAWEFAFLTHNNGMMEDNIWEGWDGHYRTILEQSGGRWFWNEERESFSPAFRVYVDLIESKIKKIK